MFTTYFYILVLIFQSLFADSNFGYNNEVKLVNDFVNHHEYASAYRLTRSMERKSIFTNNDIARMQRSLTIKVNPKLFKANYSPRSISDYVLKSLVLFQNHAFSEALSFSRNSLQQVSTSDSLIKIYELVATKSPEIIFERNKVNPNQSIKKIRFNEAMNLLDLMKRKEKTLF